MYAASTILIHSSKITIRIKLFPPPFLSLILGILGILSSYHIFPFLRLFSNSSVILSLSASGAMLSF